jgi:hypothetical protein
MKLNENVLFCFLLGLVIILSTQECSAQQTPPSSGGSVAPINFIRIWVPTIAFSNEADIIKIARSPEEVRQNTRYFDGLGRPIQTVDKQGSPIKVDVVTPMVYDAFGRESKKYLPVITNTMDGWYKTGLIDAAGNYLNNTTFTNPYDNGLADKIADDQRPYTETVFEPSPLNRPDKDFGSGKEWYDNNRHVKHGYLVNIHGTSEGQEKVIAWTIDANGAPAKAAAVLDYVETGGYYSNGQLSVKSTKDEQGNEVREYVDKEGHTILKKVQVAGGTAQTNNDAHWAMTYYIYDDLGNLSVVLPPEAVKAIIAQ